MSDKSSPPVTNPGPTISPAFADRTPFDPSTRRCARNLTVCGPHDRPHRRLLYGRSYTYRFSERKGTPLFHTRLSDDPALDVLAHRADGHEIRQARWLAGGGKDTTTRYAARTGGHAVSSTTS